MKIKKHRLDTQSCHTFAELSMDGVLITDEKKDNQIVFANRMITEMLGYSTSELLSMNLKEIGFKEDITTYISLENIKNPPKELKSKEGELRYFQISIYPIELDKGDPYHIWILKDQTKELITEKELKDQKESFYNTVEKNVDGILILDKNNRIYFLNNSAKKLLNQHGENLIGQEFAHPIVEKDKAEIEIIKPDGNISIAELRTTNILWNHKEAVLVMFRDITDRKNAEKEREVMQKQILLSAKLASIGELAAGVAHEINNPLAIIKGYTTILRQLLKKKKIDDSEYLEALKIQDSSIDRIKAIIDGLRTYARTERSNKGHNVFDIHNIISEMTVLVSKIYKNKGVSINLELEATNPIIKGDQGRFQQIIMNFLSNAKDAIESTKNSTITISTQNQGHLVTIKIIDNGCGIEPENINKIFDPFFTTKPVGKGTGLGMSITYSLVKEFGGKIDCESKVNEGTTFTVTFPLATKGKAKDIVIEQKEYGPDKIQSKLSGTVLLVEDEDDLRKLFAYEIQEAGMIVEEASNGEMALRMIEDKNAQNKLYDILVTDLKMPKMSGEQLIFELDKKGLLKKMRVIAMTGGVGTISDKKNELIFHNKIDGYLSKPFSWEDFSNILNNFSQASRKKAG